LGTTDETPPVFGWVEDWIRVPEPSVLPGAGRTHGVVCTRNDDVLIFHQAQPSVLHYNASGVLIATWGDYPGAHGMTLVEEGGEEFLWLTDEFSGKVEKCNLRGEVVAALLTPPHAAYRDTRFIPTWVAVDEERHGGTGDIWVADGYGAQLVHRFDSAGAYLQTIDGTEGAGRFRCPHGLGFDLRSGKERNLYIADRGNKRLQVYAPDGSFRKTSGESFLTSPDIFIPLGNLALIPELFGRLTLLDMNDQPLGFIGEHPGLQTYPGWANEIPVTPGLFNSPHSAAADGRGNIYVVEWRTGGRVVKLVKK
jgi:hypothetical protein